MKIPKKRCLFCHQWYAPDPRTWRHQKACGKPACKRIRHAQADRGWRIRHPRRGENWKLKVRAWARNYPYYWRHYRRAHPDYCRRDNRRRVLSARQASFSAKTDAIRQIAVEKIRSIQGMGEAYSAKTDAIGRRVEGIVDLLSWMVEGVHSAKYRRYGFWRPSAVDS